MAFKPIEVSYLKLKAFLGTTLGSELDEWSQAFAEEVAAKLLSYSQDTAAKRPAAGQANRLFKATDTGLMDHDTGATWEPLVGPGMGVYGALTNRVGATDFEPSASRPTLVVVTALQGAGTRLNILVGGVEIASSLAAPGGNSNFNLAFIVPPGKKWRWEQLAGSVVEVKSSYLTL